MFFWEVNSIDLNFCVLYRVLLTKNPRTVAYSSAYSCVLAAKAPLSCASGATQHLSKHSNKRMARKSNSGPLAS